MYDQYPSLSSNPMRISACAAALATNSNFWAISGQETELPAADLVGDGTAETSELGDNVELFLEL